MKTNLTEKYELCVKNRQDIQTEENAAYEEIYYNLEKQYKEKTGDFYMIKRINMYILSKYKAQIVLSRQMNNTSFAELANQYGVPESTMKKFLAL
jgi:hypothetical protein